MESADERKKSFRQRGIFNPPHEQKSLRVMQLKSQDDVRLWFR